MMANQKDDQQQLRTQVAAVAARMIAQDGAEYGSAKRKAARQVLGDHQPNSNLIPDDLEVEEEVRKYHALFHADTQPGRLLELRKAAVQVMEALSEFSPYLTGAVLNGSAGEHDDIHLQLFVDSPKDVEIFLLSRDVNIEISETPHFKGGRHDPVETVSFMWRREGVHAELYETRDLRGALRPRADGSMPRAGIDAVRALVAETNNVNEE
ncbi:hypothetical protein [Massilia cavernae]|uniref:UDP-N-acetylmuramate--alanine ligase n=1 Tax=Massilia cavernae TaxID=2320864 RepID=A0A418XER6_9BURK|nr:hypothetical protein [Massilia cavernae]RJG10828.1 hypothetical protein D3872_21325 [Massilia cavernae]